MADEYKSDTGYSDNVARILAVIAIVLAIVALGWAIKADNSATEAVNNAESTLQTEFDSPFSNDENTGDQQSQQ